MQTVCCVCQKTKSQAGWIQGQVVSKASRVSHGYCPDCFDRTMERVQGWLLARSAGTHGLALGR